MGAAGLFEGERAILGSARSAAHIRLLLQSPNKDEIQKVHTFCRQEVGSRSQADG